ncbi:phytanoyl-CoA dioxygenase family protein [Niastella sp. OAS944]|uniref:phytanoyl-CoA dioxygenase family protein n=1 Tax=Niastella sp. OAS944 TaxID=2664089 RepID=UPI0034819B1A|nr:ectoine hydroxylase-related dioxygenase (phytanoyl-CoA dioxygenase family) [Chitinophagaceae bacterium OAS944]
MNLHKTGFTIIDNVFTSEEVAAIIDTINRIDTSGPAFRKTSDLFAIRRFLKEVPAISSLVFNSRLRSVIDQLFGPDYFLVKSIYFDKPEQSNWFVAYHQDLTISVNEKKQVAGFEQWTVKNDQFAVQPPVALLENIFTIRIHLDDTDENNGALKIVPGSHRKGIYRPETIDWNKEQEVVCKVQSGGIMIMQPLLLHASNRTTNNNKRRVIHLEFSNQLLPGELQWAEYLPLNNFAATS